jgi:hypothetical protein
MAPPASSLSTQFEHVVNHRRSLIEKLPNRESHFPASPGEIEEASLRIRER